MFWYCRNWGRYKFSQNIKRFTEDVVFQSLRNGISWVGVNFNSMFLHNSISWVTIHFEILIHYNKLTIALSVSTLCHNNFLGLTLVIQFCDDGHYHNSYNKCDDKCDYCSNSNCCSCWETAIFIVVWWVTITCVQLYYINYVTGYTLLYCHQPVYKSSEIEMQIKAFEQISL